MSSEMVVIDYGPLSGLIGVWEGDKGMDISPEPDGTEENPYFETLTFTEGGAVENAQSQKLAFLGYHQVVTRKSTGLVFHDQTGYWMWDQETGVVMQSLLIPRGVGVLAGGRYEGPRKGESATRLSVAAEAGDPDWGIVQSPFMRDHAKTLAFRHEITIDGATLAYRESTMLEIYGRRFEHTDTNELRRVS